MNPVRHLPDPVPKIRVRVVSMVHFFEVAEIIRVQSLSNYSKIYFSNGKTLVVAKVLRWFETQLPSNRFIRVHRTHLINRGYISNTSRSGETGLKLELKNGETIDVSKRRKAYFLNTFKLKIA
jgi:two-component system, LytTR family, response regulator